MSVRAILAVMGGLAVIAGAGCTAPTKPVVAAHSPAPTRMGDQVLTVDHRPVTIHVPASYDPHTPVPLVLMLHGRGASGAIHEDYFKIIPESERRGFLYAMPDGTEGPQHVRFWNATDACCAPAGTHVDDSAYLSDVILAIGRAYAVATDRVYLIGLSNGAFMSYRMACDHADQIAAIAALNGAMWSDPSRCRPHTAVGILEIHSRDDTTIRYDGGRRTGRVYPSAAANVANWVRFDGCDPTPERSALAQDYIEPAGVAETSIARYGGCSGTKAVELWSIRVGGHVPPLLPQFTAAVLDFLFSQ